MTNNWISAGISTDFEKAYEKVAAFIAVNETVDFTKALSELVLQTFTVHGSSFTSREEIQEAIEGYFGLRFSLADLDISINLLLQNDLLLNHYNSFRINEGERIRRQEDIENSKNLEISVFEEWRTEIQADYPSLTFEREVYPLLESYLIRVFKRHGLQTSAFLDPNFQAPDDYLKSTTELLTESINDLGIRLSDVKTEQLKSVISGFFKGISNSINRAKYIRLRADAAFGYYSLTIDPEVSSAMKDSLSALSIFLDTNFIFGVLDLHSNPFVTISKEILQSITSAKLKIEFYFAPITSEEFSRTINFHGQELIGKRWSSSASQAFVQAGTVSGIARKFHEKNSVSRIEGADFLRPYMNPIQFLTSQGIKYYNGLQPDIDTQLEYLYNEFLGGAKKYKGAKSIQHDMELMNLVSAKRAKKSTKSAFSVGALLLTCDYWLYKFATIRSREKGESAFVLIPNIFYQLLRPFVNPTENYDKAFAETFVLPEFRTIGITNYERALNRLMSLLGSYDDLPKDMIIKMISNDRLVVGLSDIDNDNEFDKTVKDFVNQELLEEKEELFKALEEKEKQSQEAEQRTKELAEQLKHSEAQRQLNEEQNKRLILMNKETIQSSEAVVSQLTQTRTMLYSTTNELTTERLQRERSEKKERLYKKILIIFISVLVALITIALLINLNPLEILGYEGNFSVPYTLTGLTVAMLLACIFETDWRRSELNIAIVGAFVGVIATILWEISNS